MGEQCDWFDLVLFEGVGPYLPRFSGAPAIQFGFATNATETMSSVQILFSRRLVAFPLCVVSNQRQVSSSILCQFEGNRKQATFDQFEEVWLLGLIRIQSWGHFSLVHRL